MRYGADRGKQLGDGALSLSHTPRRHTHHTSFHTDLDLAKRILASFDVVLISEWYGSREQQAYFRSYLGITGCDMQDGMPDARVDSSGFAIPHANRQERDEELMRDPRNKVRRSVLYVGWFIIFIWSTRPVGVDDEAPPTDSTRPTHTQKMFDALVEVNKWDRALYEWSKHLVVARVAAAHNSKGDGACVRVMHEKRERVAQLRAPYKLPQFGLTRPHIHILTATDTAASGGLHCPPLPSLPERAPLSEHTYEYAIQREYLHRETDIALAYPLAECMYPVLGHGGRRGSGM